ncbi:RNA polymerase sigma-70 factor (ECF subfamily) [Paraburkholderia bannensis]|uniref:RNA polymerase sigma-70 factor (ECF subfamily) n=1 Tax=Paraburkholderia bannensis TaxID=765414 RepID=A0A7W9TV52_9BURK|nr:MULTISPECIES: sigma-70 family RNA polymerase sigma factor [Paraburkholderia]MBB3256945.1 RNA polymerase sigma-70 factor (ECF subfamily) [Paraburkholderia sp. WP4_3_2]MBB6101899.1 RNA polymerase sigma-70 factor (ECF subfamily) [Paraburkholderia bannensis]
MQEPMPMQKQALAHALMTSRRTLIDTASRIVGCRRGGEDVVHDIWLRLEEADDFGEIRQPGGYIARMVRNHAIDRCRRLNLEAFYCAPEEAALDVACEEPSPEQANMNCQAMCMLSDALDALPERSRTAFCLYYVYGYTQREISDHLGVSSTLVNCMVRDATMHCRARLEAYRPGQ